VLKGCNFFGVKNWQTVAVVWAGALSCNKKNFERTSQLENPVECASGGDPLLLYKILCLLFLFLEEILCALQLESPKNIFRCVKGCWLILLS